MAPEIADSDGESDIVVQEPATEREQLSPRTTRPSGTARDIVTQHLSDLDSSSKKGTGSTDRLIRDLYPPTYDGAGDAETTPANLSKMIGEGPGKRRAHSGAFGTSTFVAEEPAKKRSKTYGSKSRDADSDPFGTGLPQMMEQIQTTVDTDQPIPLDQPSPLLGAQRERDRPRRVVSLMNAPQHVTTSTSSMGGYQSIELDFRNGVDVNTNPFGSLTQLSTDNDAPQGNEPSASDQLNDLLDHFANPDVQTQMMTSPVTQGSPTRPTVEPLSEGEQDGTGLSAAFANEASGSDEPSVKRRKTDLPSKSTVQTPQPKRAASIAADSTIKSSINSQPSKRGRPKSKKQADNADELSEKSAMAEMGPPPLNEQQATGRSRANTMDMSSQASQSSQPASNTKKKRQKTDRTESKFAEEPKKHPSSELGLNDESVIGLPKEQYKPRPSRSRSKRVADPDEIVVETATPARDHEEPAVTPAPPAPVEKTSTAKSKKKKVKRAKTSAAALLKPSAPMLSDGEDDVVWMDTKPAAVHLELPPQIKALKKEKSENDEEQSEDELQRKDSPPGAGPATRVSVEIPLPRDPGEAQSDGASDGKPKKKRGRPKKADKEKQAASAAAKASETPETPTTKDAAKGDRPALATKDPNTTQAQTKGKGKAKSKAVITDSDDEEEDTPIAAEPPKKATSTPSKPIPAADKENDPATATTPPASKTAATPSAKPTHSPLKPTPLSASSSSLLTRHRVGLSKRSKIPSLLRKVDRHKPPPTKTGVKVKELKVKGVNDGGEVEGGADGDGDGDGKWTGVLRDKEGRLVEWDF